MSPGDARRVFEERVIGHRLLRRLLLAVLSDQQEFADRVFHMERGARG